MSGETVARSRWKRVLSRLALVFASIAATLLAAEGVVRALGMHPPARPKPLTIDYSRPVDGVVKYELVPNKVETWDYPPSPSHDERIVSAHINSLGFRGREFAAKKPAGVRRVVCVGDSFTFGTGVEDGESWPAQLGAYFDAKLGAGKVEVWNCAVEGYDTAQEIGALEARWLALEPDAVLIGYYANDAATGEVEPRKLNAFTKRVALWCGDAPPEWMRSLRSKSWLAELLAQRVVRSLLWSRPSELQNACYEDGLPGWEMVKRELLRGRELCRTHRADFAVVLYPTLQHEGEHLATHDAYAKLKSFCSSNAIACLDLEPVLEKLRVEDLWVYELDTHPGAKLHAIAANVIGKWLSARAEFTAR